jgi:FMN phosphatase YigB (HAD superfamily)
MIRPAKLHYKALLLDMNGTFMFGEDRFGPTEDFFRTYQGLGAARLGAAEVERAIRSVYRGMSADYADPGRLDDFPSLAESLRRHTSVPEGEIAAMERVFAAHEIGCIPQPFVNCLQRLGSSHQLGIVSNIWARKEPWLRHFVEIDVAHLWRTTVFSSDTRSIKPSPVLFERAIGELGLRPSDILFVGDSLKADILPAKTLGMGTAWVGPAAEPHSFADWTAPSLLELEEALR